MPDKNDDILVQELYEDMNQISGYDEEEDIIADTSYKAHQLEGDRQFYAGTVKITKELQKNAKFAVESRLKAVAPYHEQRIQTLNESYQLYSSTEITSDTLIQMFYPEIYNSCEDWIDDFIMIFTKFIDYLVLTDKKADLETYITKSLAIEEPDLDNGMLSMLMSFIKNYFGKEATQRNTTYYFQKKDLIKDFLTWGLRRSGFKKNKEKFFEYGVIGGSFITKDEYSLQETDYQITFEKQGEVYESVFNPKTDPAFKFLPIDPRRLIIPKGPKPPWGIEESDVTVSQLLSEATDENGEQRKDSKYDLKAIKKVVAWLKENRQDDNSAEEEEDKKLDGEISEYSNDIDDQRWLDACLKLYEVHYVPLVMPGDKVPKKTRLYCVNISEDLIRSPNIFLIGAEVTPFVVRFPYQCTQFITKENSWFGMALPTKLRDLQDLLNSVNNHYVDLMNLGLWGIMLLDPDKIEDATQLNEIRERMIIKVKNLRGRPATDVATWLHPPTENMRIAEGYLDKLVEIIKRTSRKGPTGEKVAPDPSATEFQSMTEELKKSVNRTSLRVNDHLVEFTKTMYKYYLLNYRNYFTFRAEAYRLFGLKEDEFVLQLKTNNLNSIRDRYRKTTKLVELTPRELIVEGLDFDCEAFDYHQKEAVERQQTMQAVDLIYRNGIMKKSDGSPNVLVDDAGSPVVISEFKLLQKVFKVLNIDNIFDPISKHQDFNPVQAQVPGTPSGASSGTTTPPLNASVRPGDIQGSAINAQ